MSSKRYIQFQKQLQGDSDQPIAVILDNAKYHHSKETHFLQRKRNLKSPNHQAFSQSIQRS
jgi:transposase